jgi:hypothetical protein
MVDSDDLYGPMEVDDDLSTALGAETLADRNMVPPGFDNTPGAMSAECERVFSSAKKLITPERNALADNTIEACECLKAWWDQGLIRGQRDV